MPAPATQGHCLYICAHAFINSNRRQWSNLGLGWCSLPSETCPQKEEMDITLLLSFALPTFSLQPMCLSPINRGVTRPISTASINKNWSLFANSNVVENQADSYKDSWHFIKQDGLPLSLCVCCFLCLHTLPLRTPRGSILTSLQSFLEGCLLRKTSLTILSELHLQHLPLPSLLYLPLHYQSLCLLYNLLVCLLSAPHPPTLSTIRAEISLLCPLLCTQFLKKPGP